MVDTRADSRTSRPGHERPTAWPVRRIRGKGLTAVGDVFIYSCLRRRTGRGMAESSGEAQACAGLWAAHGDAWGQPVTGRAWPIVVSPPTVVGAGLGSGGWRA